MKVETVPIGELKIDPANTRKHGKRNLEAIQRSLKRFGQARAIRNHESKTILDPFLGSGSTLIAAEQLERACHGIEISPAYVDVTIERWENLTGGKAKRK